MIFKEAGVRKRMSIRSPSLSLCFKPQVAVGLCLDLERSYVLVRLISSLWI